MRGRHGLLNAGGYGLGRLVFPSPQYCPARRGEQAVSVGVPGLVSGQLVRPERGVCGGAAPVLRASMPEAAVDEHRDSCGSEDDVRTAAQSGQWGPINPVPQPRCMQEAADRQLGGRIAGAL